MSVLQLILAAGQIAAVSFSIPPLVNTPLDTLVVSAPVTPYGYNVATPISVSGQGSPQISVNGAAYTSSTLISPGQSFTVRLTSSTNGQTVATTVTIGGNTGLFTVTSMWIAAPTLLPYILST